MVGLQNTSKPGYIRLYYYCIDNFILRRVVNVRETGLEVYSGHTLCNKRLKSTLDQNWLSRTVDTNC